MKKILNNVRSVSVPLLVLGAFLLFGFVFAETTTPVPVESASTASTMFTPSEFVAEQARYVNDILKNGMSMLGNSFESILFLPTENISKQAPILNMHSLFYQIANIGFLLGLVAVGFMLMFNGGKNRLYQLRSILPRFVLSVLFVNFGILFMHFFTDIATILTKVAFVKILNIAQGLQLQSFPSSLGVKILYSVFGFNFDKLSLPSTDTYVTASLLLALFSSTIGVVFLFIRSIALSFIIASSPIAIFLWFIPTTEQITRRWVQLFFILTFTGPIAAFALLLGISYSDAFADSAISPVSLLFGSAVFLLLPTIPVILNKIGSAVDIETVTEAIKESSSKSLLASASAAMKSPIVASQSTPTPGGSDGATQQASSDTLGHQLNASLADTASFIQDKLKIAAQGAKKLNIFGQGNTVPAGNVTIDAQSVLITDAGKTVSAGKADRLSEALAQQAAPVVDMGRQDIPLSPPLETVLFERHQEEDRSVQAINQALGDGNTISHAEFARIIEVPEERHALDEKQLTNLFHSGSTEQKDTMLATMDEPGYWTDSQQGVLLGLAVQDRVQEAVHDGNVDWNNVAVQAVALGAPLPADSNQLQVALKSGQFTSLAPVEIEDYYKSVGKEAKDVLLASLEQTDASGKALWDENQKGSLQKLAADDRIGEAKQHVQAMEDDASPKQTIRDEDLKSTGKLVTLGSIQDTLKTNAPLPAPGDVKASILAGALHAATPDLLNDLFAKGDDKLRYVLTSTRERKGFDGSPVWTPEQQQAIVALDTATTKNLEEPIPANLQPTTLNQLYNDPDSFRQQLYSKSLPIPTQLIPEFFKNAPEPIKEILIQSLDAKSSFGDAVWSDDEKGALQSAIRKVSEPLEPITSAQPLSPSGPLTINSDDTTLVVRNWLANPNLPTMDFVALEKEYTALTPDHKEALLRYSGDPLTNAEIPQTIKVGLEFIAGMEALSQAKSTLGNISQDHLAEGMQKTLKDNPSLVNPLQQVQAQQGNVASLTPQDIASLFAQATPEVKSTLLASIDTKDAQGNDLWNPEQKNALVGKAGQEKLVEMGQQKDKTTSTETPEAFKSSSLGEAPAILTKTSANEKEDAVENPEDIAQSLMNKDADSTLQEQIKNQLKENDDAKSGGEGEDDEKETKKKKDDEKLAEDEKGTKKKKQQNLTEQLESIEAGKTLLITPEGAVHMLDEGVIRRAEDLFNPENSNNFTNLPFSVEDLISIAHKIKAYATKKAEQISSMVADFLKKFAGEE